MYEISHKFIEGKIHEAATSKELWVAVLVAPPETFVGDLGAEVFDLLPEAAKEFVNMFPDMAVGDAKYLLEGKFALSGGKVGVANNNLKEWDKSEEYSRSIGVLGAYKVEDIKSVRYRTGAGLKEAKYYVESLDWTTYYK